ncbi:MAG: NAD(P)H-binding protein [Nonomuraea sp.]|nr:NAD(P)H-binding protein [Nonomuraea sp.]
MTENTTVVIGGGGKTGARVMDRLKAKGVPARGVSRSTQIPFDWNDPATWPAAIAGAERVYLTYQPDLAAPGAADAVRAFTALAVESGVRRIVLLSGRGEPEAAVSERTVRDSGLEWTILRCAFFNQNFSEGDLAEQVGSGVIVMPVQGAAEPFLDADDIADVAVAALTEDRHVGKLYELTGPRLMTFGEVAAEISKAWGREVRFVPVSPEEYTAMLTENGLPGEIAAYLTQLFTDVLDGRNQHLNDGVRQALGREPRDFAGYAALTWKPGS